MVKFLHTADWHLGITYTKLGTNAQKAREIRIATVRKLMEVAKASGVDFIIVAGDLFDNNDVDRALIEVTTDVLRTAEPIPVYILPGNHDPLTKDSLYLAPSWDSIDNATVLKKKEPIEIPELNVTLYPCPVTQKRTREDLTEWIRTTNRTISIGIAHGNLQIEGFVDNPNFPIDPERVEKSGLDYLALGEWHSLFKYRAKDGSPRTVYPGTPETTKFGEPNSGKAVIVEIEDHGAAPIIQEINVGATKWEEWKRQIFSIDDIKHVERELDQIKKPEYKAINLYFEGVVDQEAADYLTSFERKHSKRFLYLNIIKREFYLKPNWLMLKAMLPEGAIFHKTIDALQSLMKCQPTLQQHSEISPKEAEGILREIREIDSVTNTSPEVLERAFLLLYQMAKGVLK